VEGEGVDGEGVDGEGVDVEEVEEPATDANTLQKTKEAGQPPPPPDSKAGCDADANTTAASRVPSYGFQYECCLLCSMSVFACTAALGHKISLSPASRRLPHLLLWRQRRKGSLSPVCLQQR